MRTEAEMQITLAALRDSFGVNTAPAQELHGQELADWLEQAEDAVFKSQFAPRTYQIDPRPQELGGGWNLKLFEGGEEMGGGVFPLVPNTDGTDFDAAYQDATDEGEAWAG